MTPPLALADWTRAGHLILAWANPVLSWDLEPSQDARVLRRCCVLCAGLLAEDANTCEELVKWEKRGELRNRERAGAHLKRAAKPERKTDKGGCHLYPVLAGPCPGLPPSLGPGPWLCLPARGLRCGEELAPAPQQPGRWFWGCPWAFCLDGGGPQGWKVHCAEHQSHAVRGGGDDPTPVSGRFVSRRGSSSVRGWGKLAPAPPAAPQTPATVRSAQHCLPLRAAFSNQV